MLVRFNVRSSAVSSERKMSELAMIVVLRWFLSTRSNQFCGSTLGRLHMTLQTPKYAKQITLHTPMRIGNTRKQAHWTSVVRLRWYCARNMQASGFPNCSEINHSLTVGEAPWDSRRTYYYQHGLPAAAEIGSARRSMTLSLLSSDP